MANYRSTKRNDTFVGQTTDDTFFMHLGGDDEIHGKEGFDVARINYSKATENGYFPLEFNLAADGDITAYLFPEDGSSLYIDSVDRIAYHGFAADEDTTINADTTTDHRGAFGFNGGQGYDKVTLFFNGDGDSRFHVAPDNSVHTSIGRFVNIELFVVVFGGGDDIARGGANADVIFGGGGSDRLSGGGGNDLLSGGLGGDRLAGGAGADVFAWREVAESRPADEDRVLDFSHAEGDTIDLSRVDASDRKGFQHFTFIDQAAFSAKAGTSELRQEVGADGLVTLQGDSDHDGAADFVIAVAAGVPLVASDLIL